EKGPSGTAEGVGRHSRGIGIHRRRRRVTNMVGVLGTIEWSQVSALAACAGVIVAMIFHMKNLANTWLSNSAKMVLELSGKFNSEEMRKYRSRFAQVLLTNRSKIDLRYDNPVLGFLEEIGYMTRRGVLDKGMVWNSFFWLLEHYYVALTSHPDLLEQARAQT